MRKVKIIGLSINKDFGGLRANSLRFDSGNKLTLIKGGVGAGKTTLNKALRLTTQGSSTLEDKRLYGDVDITARLKDGKKEIFVECKSLKDGKIGYVIYTEKDGKRVKNVVIDGQKLTPAGYLKGLQTALTWRLDELTSENTTVQRNILLELYHNELEDFGVVFNKANPKYVGGLIDTIEKAKAKRTLKDALRKEVGGIADDLSKKGIDYEERRALKDAIGFEKAYNKINAQISIAEADVEQAKKSRLNDLKSQGSEISIRLHLLNDEIKKRNEDSKTANEHLSKIKKHSKALGLDAQQVEDLIENILAHIPKIKETERELEFDKKGRCKSKPKYFNGDLKALLKQLKHIAANYVIIKEGQAEAATAHLHNDLATAKTAWDEVIAYNNESDAVNAFHEWRDANDEVDAAKTKYYKKLTKINTGVEGLFIKGDDDDIYLVYDGSYDKKYFNNLKKEPRKLSAYSGTQRPMICLLVQQYLLSKKVKALPYLFIDDIPFDNKTIKLLNKMADELGLWLFVNWTGDFKARGLKKGEILLENGNILFEK